MADIDSREIERRRAVRTKLAVPVRLTGQSRTGDEFTVQAETHTVSNSGCLLHSDAVLSVDQTLTLHNQKTGQSIKARVVSTWRHPEGRVFVGLEFLSPSQDFWPAVSPVSQSSDASQPKD